MIAVIVSLPVASDVLPDALFPIVVAVGVLMAVMALVSIGYVVYRAMSHHPILVVDQAGFYDGASAVGVGRVEWPEVRAISIRSQTGQQFVSVEVWDPSSVVGRQRSALKRALLRYAIRRGWGTATIMESLLPMPIQEVARVMNEARAAAATRPRAEPTA